MIIKISIGQDIIRDGCCTKTIKFKELLLKTQHFVSFTIRRYPKNTVVMGHWGDKSKKLFKEPHYEADNNIGNMLDYINNRYNLRLSGLEFESILDSYNQMKYMNI